MSAAELAPLIDALPRIEKFQRLQFLVTSIAKEENLPSLDPTVTYPLWTPYNVPVETVAALATLLDEDTNAT